jgi:hypothetical protein
LLYNHPIIKTPTLHLKKMKNNARIELLSIDYL